MADFSNLKMQIADAIKANGNGAITGPLLQEQLLDMVDAMEIDAWGGMITADTIAPTDTTSAHLLLAVTPGEYDTFGNLKVEEGDIWLVARLAGEVEWTLTNLTAGLKSLIESISGDAQKTLTPGDGIVLDTNGNISVKVGSGMQFDTDGNLIPGADMATTEGVKAYIDEQKGAVGGIAPLDTDGKVDKDNLPDNVAYIEASGNPMALVDEYGRLLAELYQSLIDAQTVTDASREATVDSRTATTNAETAAQNAAGAASNASQSAQKADEARIATAQVIQSATDLMTAVNNALSQLTNTIQQAQRATGYANDAGAAATDAANNAIAKSELANTAAALANEKAVLADNKADYATVQGDYAKAQGDYAKSTAEAFVGRVDVLEKNMLLFERNADPTSLL